MDVRSPCALLQTKLKGGTLESFLTHNRNKPLQIVGALAGVISLMVMVTVVISTVTFLRNKKSNRVTPNRRVRRRPRSQNAWTLKNLFRKPENPEETFQVEEDEQDTVDVAENVNHNNNVSNVVRHWHPPAPPPPPRAPSLPPPPPPSAPGERKWVVPTVSAAVAARPRKKPAAQDMVNNALVSELKMRLEQKRMLNHL